MACKPVPLTQAVVACASLLVWALGMTHTHAATIRVPAEHGTIQAAIDAAVHGDTVLVGPGSYVENITFRGKAVNVMSEAGPELTIIDGNRAGSVVTFGSGEGPTSVLNGFTVRNGESFDGGGIWISLASPTITDNIISGNRACSGVGVMSQFGSPVIQRNIITANTQWGCSGGPGGGGILIRGASSAQILENVISNNYLGSADGGGIALFAAGTPTIRGNVITGNTATGIIPCAKGGGLSLGNQSDALIVGNVITGNHAGCGGGIYWGVPYGTRGPRLVNNTIADNVGAAGSGIYAAGFDAQTEVVNNIVVAAAGETAVFCESVNDPYPPSFRFNNVFSATGVVYGGICGNSTGTNGNISTDPLFVNPANGDYHLLSGSPAIDTGDSAVLDIPSEDLDRDARLLDGDSSGTAVVDMGAEEFDPLGFPLTVTTAGNGLGTVMSTPPGIRCGVFCSGTFPPSTVITLTAMPVSGSPFTGWTGEGCSGTGACQVTMSQARTVTATFLQNAHAIGVFRPADSTFYLDYNTSGQWDGCGTDKCLPIGMTGDVALIGDWNGSGSSKVGVFRPSDGTFYLDYNGSGAWEGCGTDRYSQIGLNGDVPLVGDWNSAGTSKVGVFRPSDGTFYLDYNGNGAWDGCGTDRCLQIGLNGDIPLVGDWSGSGTIKVGTFRPSDGTFYLDYNGSGTWEGCGTDRCLQIGMLNGIPLVGDWNGTGTSKVGVFRPSDGTFYLGDNGSGTWEGCGTDRCLQIGLSGDIPFVGDWNGSGTAKVGVFRPADGTFYLDYNGSGTWEGCGTDRCLQIGMSGDTPLVGKW